MILRLFPLFKKKKAGRHLPPARISLQLALVVVLLSACIPEQSTAIPPYSFELTPSPVVDAASANQSAEDPGQPFPTRPPFQPGELVDYTAQTGDTVPALAARFNTSIPEIRKANPIIPNSATTMPPGMPMKIPIYYRPLWGNPYQIVPDSLFIDGPAQVGFDTVKFVDQQPGWLKYYSEYIGGQTLRGGQVVDFVAQEYSVSPRLLLAVSEYLDKALTQSEMPDPEDRVLLGRSRNMTAGYYRQIAWVADTLNDGYYRWRSADLLELNLSDGRLERPDPWQNAATIALQNYFNIILFAPDYEHAISDIGIAKTYQELFGDPWSDVKPHLPGSLEQPAFALPFEKGKVWAFTGGPHSAWGDGASPLAAVDFAPPSVASGCLPSDEWATSVADGVIVRKGTGIAVVDTDGDGDEHTGWVIFYLHLETSSIPALNTHLKTGDPIGHPSCEGGHSTGTHVHIARKYNGEWMLADSLVPFNLEGWVVHYSSIPYEGTLTRNGRTVVACTCSDRASHIQSEGQAHIQP